MMKRRLPSFASVKAFEAAARHCNFQLAADELSISASAVSHQVKSLEEYIGMPLFTRKNNRLFLREEAKVYLESLSNSLDQIEAATNSISRVSGKPQITLNLYPSLANMWLIPNLPDFNEKNSDITVRIITSELNADAIERETDFALLLKSSDNLEQSENLLFKDEISPIATSDYLDSNPQITAPKDLLDHTLISSISETDEWKCWFDAMGVTVDRPLKLIELDMTSSAIRAAKEGLGVAMGRRPYIDADMKEGLLKMPLPDTIVHTNHRHILHMTARGRSLAYSKRMQDWLIEVSNASASVW